MSNRSGAEAEKVSHTMSRFMEIKDMWIHEVAPERLAEKAHPSLSRGADARDAEQSRFAAWIVERSSADREKPVGGSCAVGAA